MKASEEVLLRIALDRERSVIFLAGIANRRALADPEDVGGRSGLECSRKGK